MREQINIELIKKMAYERTSCICGVAVFERDPTPELTEAIRNIAKKYNARFKLTDANVSSEVVKQYKIEKLPAVIINEKPYPAEVETIHKALQEHRE